jgi:hypothetical protein
MGFAIDLNVIAVNTAPKINRRILDKYIKRIVSASAAITKKTFLVKLLANSLFIIIIIYIQNKESIVI